MFHSPKNKKRGRPKGAKNKRRGRPPKEQSFFPEDHEELLARVSPRMRRAVFLVLFFIAGALGILSIFGGAGILGRYYKLVLVNIFGWAYFCVPFFILALAYFILRSERYHLRKWNYFGAFLLVLNLVALFQLVLARETSFAEMKGVAGGGYLGFAATFFLQKFLGFWGSLVLVIGFFVLGFLLTFNISLKKAAESAKDGLTDLGAKLKSRDSIEIKDLDGEKNLAANAALAQAIKREKKRDRPWINLPVDLNLKNQEKKTAEVADASWSLPPSTLLKEARGKPVSGNIRLRSQIIQKTLSDFGISVEMAEVHIGPTVTQYTLKPATGVKLRQITTLQNDLSLALAAHPIRIEAPIPGKSLVGIEVPNQEVALVRLKDILMSSQFYGLTSALKIALGKDVAGNPVAVDLERMPHLLIGGATGSGKSVCLNTVILSLLYQCSPRELKFILVDPKRVEMTSYNNLPHLLTPVVTDPKKTVNALKWAVKEMDRRFQVLSEAGKRNIAGFNAACIPEDRLPYIVVVIDELADLMAVAANEVEAAIVRLAQMARATGIHLVVATQRPSVDVITGLIKANITSRIAFNVASQIDSRTIIDGAGADKLLGNGDMLFISSTEGKPKRIQGALVSDSEIEAIVKFLGKQEAPEFNAEVTEKQGRLSTNGLVLTGDEAEIDDELFGEAKELVIQSGKASASLLQRRLKVGYARAARLLDYLEEQGIVGPADGAKPRDILTKSGVEIISPNGGSEAPASSGLAEEDLERIRTFEDQERNNGNY
ncbi:MAG: cell division protein FtsK [Candidatus Nealsonbacteria bacterium CG08_land_8_20_14_0_20_38_20]|uniref:Cell division protein FtsK n=1 Tax=Candidatus Nealsonbacteria bacterium CG08_land_8_20_14_0_20_38_20 TaxID=1974705 RepID=A0A2H0YLA1_9BACT|nr:MAG: cell division protein FtsK [Candidatus Nealsonbacteria bacterium CG08_land_8_20_14_0_20_38_20]